MLMMVTVEKQSNGCRYLVPGTHARSTSQGLIFFDVYLTSSNTNGDDELLGNTSWYQAAIYCMYTYAFRVPCSLYIYIYRYI